LLGLHFGGAMQLAASGAGGKIFKSRKMDWNITDTIL
jgi:hypothetical protein